MPESDQPPYFENTYTIDSVHPEYWRPSSTYGTAFPAPPPQDESSYVCPPASQNTIPSSAYETQTLEAPQHYPPRSMELWAPSPSGDARDPMVAGSLWGYPTNMDASALKGSISAETHWILNQPQLSGFHGMYPSEPQQGTLPSSVSSFDTELDKLHLGNTVQQAPGVPSPAEYPGTGSESEPVIASAEWAKDLAPRNVSEATENAAPIPGIQAYTPHQMDPPPEVAYDSSSRDEGWQYSSGGGTVPTFTLEAEVEDFPWQDTPTQWVSAKPEDGDAGHKQKYTRSSSPQIAFSQERQQKLYKFVSGRVEKRSRDKRSTACDECGRRKVRCTVVSLGGSCQSCVRANHRCTWNKRSGLDERGNIRFKHCRPVQA